MADDGSRNPGFRVVQLGDAVSLGYDEVEAEFYTWLGEWVDTWCIGNHEAPALWFNDHHTHMGWDADRWHGWHTGRDREAERLVRQRFMQGGYLAATSIGPWLITHAGVLPRFQRQYDMLGKTAEENARFLNEEFERAMLGREAPALLQGEDSIFWVRIWELAQGYRSSGPESRFVPQLVGHTPSRDYAPQELVKNRLWCIDSPPVHHRIHGGVVGLLFDENDEITQMIYEE